MYSVYIVYLFQKVVKDPTKDMKVKITFYRLMIIPIWTLGQLGHTGHVWPFPDIKNHFQGF